MLAQPLQDEFEMMDVLFTFGAGNEEVVNVLVVGGDSMKSLTSVETEKPQYNQTWSTPL